MVLVHLRSVPHDRRYRSQRLAELLVLLLSADAASGGGVSSNGVFAFVVPRVTAPRPRTRTGTTTSTTSTLYPRDDDNGGHISHLLRMNQQKNSVEEASSKQMSSSSSSSIGQHNQKQPPNGTALEFLRNCATATQARRILEKALPADSSRLYNSIAIPPGASIQGISDGDLAIQTRLVNKKYQIMELIELSGDRDMDRASVGILCLTISSTVAAVTVNQNLSGVVPEILRFLVVWLLTFAPLAFVGYGIKDAEQLQATLVQVQRMVFPAYRQRMVQHEAGHFLLAHLLGFPIEGYTTNAVRNAVSFYPLSDADRGRELANQLGFDRPAAAQRSEEEQDLWPLPISTLGKDAPSYFSKDGRGGDLVEERSVFRDSINKKNYTKFSKLPSQNDPTNAWPYRGFDETTLDQLTVVSVAGVCSEILAFGNAEGGVADLSQLRQIFQAAEEKMTDREVDNRIRFALGYTLSQLRRHLGALDALAKVMDRGGSVAECVMAIETCENVSGQDGIMGGDYELQRRKRFQEGVGWIEKNVDTAEDRFAEGRGGGDRKQEFALTGDDPLYAALAVSLAFLAWAGSGGLSLH